MGPNDIANPNILSMPITSGFWGVNAVQIFTVDGIYLTGDSNAVAVGSMILKLSSPTLTVSNHRISLRVWGTIFFYGTTIILAPTPSTLNTKGEAVGFTIRNSATGNDGPTPTSNNDCIYPTDISNVIVMDGKTISPSSPYPISSHTISMKGGGPLPVDDNTRDLISSRSLTSRSDCLLLTSRTRSSKSVDEDRLNDFMNEGDRR